MEIKGTNIANTGQVETELLKRTEKEKEADANEPVKESRRANTNDYSINLSQLSKDISAAKKRAIEIAGSTPDIRQDKIDSIRDKIKNSEYVIDSGKIADGILRESIRDHLARTS